MNMYNVKVNKGILADQSFDINSKRFALSGMHDFTAFSAFFNGSHLIFRSCTQMTIVRPSIIANR